MLSLFLIAITALRIFLAASGHLNEQEAYLLLCGQHLDWSFIDGPAGVPAIMRLCSIFLGATPLAVRLFAPLMVAAASFAIAALARSLHNEKVAWWSVIAFNFFPLTNAAALVMDGTLMVASLWIITVVMAWRVMSGEKKQSIWIFFGLFLALGTQFSYSIGLLLLLVFLWEFLVDGKCSCYAGAGVALLCLGFGWVGPLYWNLHHDWLSWSQTTWLSFWSWNLPCVETNSPFFWSALFLFPLLFFGVAGFFILRPRYQHDALKKEIALLILLTLPFFFYFHQLGHGRAGFSWMLALLGLTLPWVVAFCLKKSMLQKLGLSFLVLSGIFSMLLVSGILSPINKFSCWKVPGARGVTGLQPMAVEILRWRAIQQQDSGKSPFIIAQTPGLAALLGSVLPVAYPELPGAPSVFVPESPSFETQFQLWPHYAEATATATVDPFYTEEKVTSPFLDHDAFYVTPEILEEIPQTIHSAFASVEPLGEAIIDNEGKKERLFIYRCKNYQMLSL